MARRYKPLPAGAIVWVRHWQYFAEVITDAGAGEVRILARMRKYDYERWARRRQIRPASAAEADAHRQQVAQIMQARLAAQAQVQVQVQAALDELAAAARVTPAPADPAG